jgi:hypothetical protein
VNPVLKALEMKTMANQYGSDTLAFPLSRPKSGWPVMTWISQQSLANWKAELSTDWAKRLPTLDDTWFCDRKHVSSAEAVGYAKADVAQVLTGLKRWVTRATKTKNAGLELLDGDQEFVNVNTFHMRAINVDRHTRFEYRETY